MDRFAVFLYRNPLCIRRRKILLCTVRKKKISLCCRLFNDRNTIAYEISNNETYLNNETLLYNVSLNEDYIFDRTDVKVIFITLYTIVFVCCFFGEWALLCLSKGSICRVLNASLASASTGDTGGKCIRWGNPVLTRPLSFFPCNLCASARLSGLNLAANSRWISGISCGINAYLEPKQRTCRFTRKIGRDYFLLNEALLKLVCRCQGDLIFSETSHEQNSRRGLP